MNTSRLRRAVLAASLLALGGAASAQAPAPAAPVTLLQNVRIFDGKGASLSAPSQVLVRGELIERVSTAPIAPPAGATVIDGQGRTLMPGLIDNHWHTMFAAPSMAQMLRRRLRLPHAAGRGRGARHADARLHHRARPGRALLRAQARHRRRPGGRPAHLPVGRDDHHHRRAWRLPRAARAAAAASARRRRSAARSMPASWPIRPTRCGCARASSCCWARRRSSSPPAAAWPRRTARWMRPPSPKRSCAPRCRPPATGAPMSACMPTRRRPSSAPSAPASRSSNTAT